MTKVTVTRYGFGFDWRAVVKAEQNQFSHALVLDLSQVQSVIGMLRQALDLPLGCVNIWKKPDSFTTLMVGSCPMMGFGENILIDARLFGDKLLADLESLAHEQTAAGIL